MVKFAADGSLAWQRTWEGPEMFASDEATEVAVAPDGSVYVTGSTQGVAGDVLLLKFSPVGSLLWQLRWGGAGTERGESVAVGADGSVYLVGGTSSFGTGSDLVVLKFTHAGTLVWQQTWGPARGDGVAVGPDGNVYVAGGAARPGGGADVILLSLAPAGTLLWQRAYSAGQIADARGGLTVAADGSIYVADGLQEPERQIVDLDALLVKFASDGTLVWDRGWGGRSGDEVQGVAVAPDGTVLLGGNTNSFGAGSDDAFLLRLQPNGRRIDAVLFGGAGIDHASEVDVAPDGTISLAGNVQAPPWVFQDGPTRTSRLRERCSRRRRRWSRPRARSLIRAESLTSLPAARRMRARTTPCSSGSSLSARSHFDDNGEAPNHAGASPFECRRQAIVSGG